MDLVSWSFVFIFFHLLCFDSAHGQTTSHSSCTEKFDCGMLGYVSFPFYKSSEPDCGLWKVDCDNRLIELEGIKFEILGTYGAFMRLKVPILGHLLKNNSCQTFDKDVNLPLFSPSISYLIDNYLTLFKCNSSIKTLGEVFDSKIFQSYACGSIILYYNTSLGHGEYPALDFPSSCSAIQLPVPQSSVAKSNNSGLFHQLSDRFTLSWTVSEECNACYYRGGMCQTNNATKEFYCRNTSKVAVDGTNAEESGARSEGPGHRRNMKVNVAAVEDAPNEGDTSESPTLKESKIKVEPNSRERKYREYICGEEALRISPTEPYCLRRPIRRGHLNVSQHYSTQQVLEDLHTIWDWILVEKLHIPHHERNMYSAILVIPETFDNREIKEMLSIVLHDLRFGSAVVHQEGLAAAFGNGLSTACIVNMGAQVTSVICVEDGVALPTTHISLRFGGEDISRCLLWTQRHHQTWPPIRTDALSKPVDLLMLNRLKESYCQIKDGEVEAVAMVHSYEDGMPPGSHKTRLTALNVPPMGLFYPMLLVPDVYPPPPRTWLKDCDDMLEDTWHMDFSGGGAYPMWESYPVYQTKPKKEDDIGLDIGLAEAITKSILATGRIDLQRKLFCSMQLIGGAASVYGLIPAVEERVLHAIPSHEAIDTVEVLQSRTNPAFVSWKGGAILGILDISREAWIHREDWIRNGIHIGSGRKYKDSYYLQAQAMCYMNL